MGSQIGDDHAFDQYYHQDPAYPLNNENAQPYNYDVGAQPHKRVRLVQDCLPDIDTARASTAQQDGLASAPLQNGSLSVLPALGTGSEPSHPRSSSVPPKSKAGRKKKKAKQNLEDPFVQESFAFPKKQTWLKPRPRQRKSAVEVPQDVSGEQASPLNDAPGARGTLYLDKHKDRIAALIARKRKDNASNLFPERMAVQQRLHHGEDDNDRRIAASHHELKRKMELSAQGIYEEGPPNGKESDGRLPVPIQSQHAQSGAHFPDTGVATRTIQPFRHDHNAVSAQQDRSCEADEDPEIEHEIISAQAFDHAGHPPVPGPLEEQPAAQLSYGEEAVAAAFWQRQTVVTERYTATAQTSYPQELPVQAHTTYPPAPLFMAQPRFPAQRYSHPQMLPQEHLYRDHYNEAPATMQGQEHQWTSQMWHALPNASTPLLQSSTVIQSTHTPQSESNIHTRGYMHQPVPINRSSGPTFGNYEPAAYDLNYYSDNPSSRASSADSSASGFEDFRAFLPHHSFQVQQLQGQYDQQEQQQSQTGSRTNVNIFTRQERENGVIGGNNNWAVESNGERRNMFYNRPG